MILGKLLKVNAGDIHTPSEEAREVEKRQEALENKLHERKFRVLIVREQVKGLRGE